MRIESLFENSHIFATPLTGKTAFEDESASSFRQKDTVSISFEARAAYEEALAAKESAGGQSGQPDDEEGNSSAKAFSDYLNKAKGNVAESSGASVEEQIEALKKKLEKLQQKLGKTAQDDSLPEEVKNARMQTINAEIEQVMGQIAELMGQLMRQA